MQDHPFLFSGRNRLIYAVSWLLITLVWAGVVLSYYQIPFTLALTDGFLSNTLFGLLGIGLYNAVRYSNLEKKSALSVLVFHLGWLLVSIFLWLGLGYFLLQVTDHEEWKYQQYFYQSVPWRIGIGIFYYSIVILLYYLIIYYQNFKITVTREAELKSMMKEAELSMLRSQINPHFLFNSLNSISSLTITDPTKAQEMIIKLSDFLRYSMGESERQMVSLKAELDYIRLYLDIEKVRFGSKLSYEWNVAEDCLQARLPNMILQPLFENAVKHGVYESTGEVLVRTYCESRDHSLFITISNSFESDAIPKKGKGMGLKNIASRLKLIYLRDDLLQREKKDGIFEVRLQIPQNQPNK
jgi:two-component system, LytTR family, sensor kinase